jgi:hypothetical protein
VTLWELFDNAAQPYADLSDLDVLNQVIRERDTKLPKPRLEQSYSDRWSVASRRAGFRDGTTRKQAVTYCITHGQF